MNPTAAEAAALAELEWLLGDTDFWTTRGENAIRGAITIISDYATLLQRDAGGAELAKVLHGLKHDPEMYSGPARTLLKASARRLAQAERERNNLVDDKRELESANNEYAAHSRIERRWFEERLAQAQEEIRLLKNDLALERGGV